MHICRKYLIGKNNLRENFCKTKIILLGLNFKFYDAWKRRRILSNWIT